MRTNLTHCDHCKAEITTKVTASFFGAVQASTSGVSLHLYAGSQGGNKKDRDFCNEACLRDFLIANLPAETTAQPSTTGA